LSSILNALKKIEDSEHGAESHGRPAAVDLPAFSWLRRRRIRPSRKSLAWALALVLALSAAIGAYYWPSADSAPRPPSIGSGEVRAKLPAAAADNTPPASAAPPSRPQASVKGSVPAAPPAKPGSQLQAPPPSTRIRPKDGPGTPATEEKALITPRAAPAQDRPARPPQAAPAATRSAEDALSRLDESKLRVMAIAWSGDPLRRLAVVNGHIVKEGESVEGYSINQIRKDDVIVNDGARSWRVELNLKTQP
jgi:hypothetical protein